MRSRKQSTTNYLLHDTAVDNQFISEFMAQAPADHIKVYLYGLMSAEYELPFDWDTLSKALSMSAEAIRAAFDYWEENGLIVKVYKDPEDRLSYDVEYVSLKDAVFGGVQAAPSAPAALSDKELAKLYRDVEITAGRPLGGKELEDIASWVGEYGMDPALILFGYKYCTENRRSNAGRYVGAVLKDWRAKGYTTVAQAEEHLGGNDRHYALYRKVFSELGFHRSPSEPEKKIMDVWTDSWGFSDDRILDACRRTTGISNPNINYVNSVLSAWRRESEKEAGGEQQQEIFSGVEALYERDRRENARKTAETRERIFTEIPRIRDILDELKDTGYQISKAVLAGAGGKERAAALRRRSEALNAEKAELLRAAGYSENATDMIYTCAKCRDTGYLDDGSRCSCYYEKAELLAKSR